MSKQTYAQNMIHKTLKTGLKIVKETTILRLRLILLKNVPHIYITYS